MFAKLTSFISLPFLYPPLILTSFQSICYYYLINEQIKMQGFEIIAQLAKHSLNIFKQNFARACVCAHCTRTCPAACRLWHKGRLAVKIFDVGLAKHWRHGILGTLERRFFEGWLLRGVCSEMLGTVKWEGGRQTSSHVSPQWLSEMHFCGGKALEQKHVHAQT